MSTLPEKELISFTPIGHVENVFDHTASPDTIKAVESKIVLSPHLVPGLTGLKVGGRVMVIFHFDRSDNTYELLQHPRGDTGRPKRGVFALCSPRRPNLIGVTVVDLVAVDDNVLRVRNLDAINGTPVLDLKPA